jgi:hypothetical protein
MPNRSIVAWSPGLLVVVSAIFIAVISARPYAGSWNDGSRLATVECLVDEGTLAIDHSIFVQVPPRTSRHEPSPYGNSEPHFQLNGTSDKLLINGHFYSDKSPVPALLMAVLYKGIQAATGLTARDRPDRFCYAMVLGTSGLAYVASVWCLFLLSGVLGLPHSDRLMLTASFGLATVALPYSRHVNNHMMLLAVAAAGMLSLARLAHQGQATLHRLIGLGTLAGLGYTIDLGAGPFLALGILLVVAYRCRRSVLAAVLAAVPWLLLHHAVNYAVGGTFKPANAVADYFRWPGSPFTADNLTGSWHHSGVGHLITYALALLAGKRGFIGHNLALWLTLPGIVMLFRRPRAGWPQQMPELLFAVGWAGCTWLIYAVTSTNYSGLCCSIRWFVPLLAPGYYGLAALLRRWPALRTDFWILSGWGVVLGGIMWWKGPWMQHLVPYYWLFQAGALLSWMALWAWRSQRHSHPLQQALPSARSRAA